MSLTVIVVYLLILIGIGFISLKQTSGYNDFFVAHKKGKFWPIAGSLAATILGGSAVLGTVDASSQMGWASWWFMLCAALGLFLLVPLIPKIHKMGRYTLPDLLGTMYGEMPQKVSSYIIPVAWLGITATQIIASARLLQSFLSLPYAYGVVISSVVFIVYTIAGGQISVLKTDLVQAIFILVGLVVIALFVVQTSFNLPQLLSQWPVNERFNFVDLFVLIITYATTFTAGPDIYSRIFCAQDVKTAQRAVRTVAFTLVPVGFLLAFIGVYGVHQLGFSGNGALLVEVIKATLPGWAAALASVALLSAVLSSADTTLLSASVIVTGLVQKNQYGKRTLPLTRVIILIIGVLSMIIALNFTSIIQTLLVALTVYAGAFTVPILWGLVGPKVQSIYVMWAIVCGGVISVVGKVMSLMHIKDLGNAMLILSFVVSMVIMFLGSKKGRLLSQTAQPKNQKK
jgi:solute:Na+ symporter, SSS family